MYIFKYESKYIALYLNLKGFDHCVALQNSYYLERNFWTNLSNRTTIRKGTKSKETVLPMDQNFVLNEK